MTPEIGEAVLKLLLTDSQFQEDNNFSVKSSDPAELASGTGADGVTTLIADSAVVHVDPLTKLDFIAIDIARDNERENVRYLVWYPPCKKVTWTTLMSYDKLIIPTNVCAEFRSSDVEIFEVRDISLSSEPIWKATKQYERVE